MGAKEISARDLREKQADVLNQVAFKGSQFIITRHGKESAVLISPEEFQLLQKTMAFLEDESDLKDAKKSLKETKVKGSKSLKELAKELGIDV